MENPLELVPDVLTFTQPRSAAKGPDASIDWTTLRCNGKTILSESDRATFKRAGYALVSTRVALIEGLPELHRAGLDVTTTKLLAAFLLEAR